MEHSKFIVSFISLFVAINVIGVLPIYTCLVGGKTSKEKKKIINIACITALFMTMSFSIIGKFILESIGITIPDFLIASGLVLVVMSIIMLLDLQYTKTYSGTTVSTVPLGTPLLAGPALLTTSLTMGTLYGYHVLFVCLILNLIIVWILLSYTDFLVKIFTEEGMKALSKLASLLIVALGIMMIRKGVMQVVQLISQ